MKLYDVIRKEQLAEGVPEKSEPEVHRTPHPFHEMHVSWKRIGIIAAAVAFIAVLYLLGIRFVHAKVVIVERQVPFSLAHTELELVHEKDASAGRLAFQTMVVTTEITREIFGSETIASTTKAKGKAVFFNEYSKTSQTVKSGTTITASNGKKYVTQQTVAVPGYTMNGKIKNPGTSIQVVISAADTGPTYNSEGTSFTVSGWSGTKAKQFYARSAGPISGGEAGARHTVSDADRPQVVATLQAQLIERLKRETRAQIPENLVTFPDMQFVSIDTDSFVLGGDSIKFPAKVKGTMISYLISRDLLETAIAKVTMSDHRYNDVSIPALGDIAVEPVSAIPTSTTNIPDAITVAITGQGTIITKAPLIEVQEALIGISRTNFSQALSDIPEIGSAKYSLIPFWAPLFPRQPKDITVIVQ
jgi:uncharacterized protein YlzI (FlbEa/FlbD family)